MKTIATITGIRPDFIRMKEIFRLLDSSFRHVMIHTGQHYDDELSRVFFCGS
jgi:UDP-N-acetylglucosamine 2-epimerase (non-hydrolysing)